MVMVMLFGHDSDDSDDIDDEMLGDDEKLWPYYDIKSRG